MALSAETKERLQRWLVPALGAVQVAITRLERLGGGAIQENLALDLTVTGGPRAGVQALVLRTDAPSTLAVSWNRLQEFAILQAAHRAGVMVPEPWVACAEPEVIGRSFYLMERVVGEARGTRIVRDPVVAEKGETLAAALGRELAKLHRVVPPVAGLEFMVVPSQDPIHARIAELRGHLDHLQAFEPVLEWGLRWLERHAPPSGDLVLVHADCRTGNYMVDEGELVALLDWEFSCYSDPLEDLGWMLARCWRFGVLEKECGGIGTRDAFLNGYEHEAGRPVERGRIAFFELLGTLRWAVVALLQADRHYSGREPSLELALTSHVVPSLESDVLDQIALLEARP